MEKGDYGGTIKQHATRGRPWKLENRCAILFSTETQGTYGSDDT